MRVEQVAAEGQLFWVVSRGTGRDMTYFVGFNDGKPTWTNAPYFRAALFLEQKSADSALTDIRRRARERAKARIDAQRRVLYPTREQA